MLLSLSIRDVVLIDRLDLSFRAGLGVLTGETGAGKSILLDSLGLALGARGDSGLVRHGREQAAVTAAFDLSPDHPARALLSEQDISVDPGEDLVLRRVLSADGRSRAFINDQPVGVGLLKRVGDLVVEIHGQFAQAGLLDPANHRATLDAHGGLDDHAEAVRAAWKTWREAVRARSEAEQELERARGDEDYLRHMVDELDRLAPQVGEEAELAERRTSLMHGEKLMGALTGALSDLNDGRGVEGMLRSAMRQLERIADKAPGKVEPIVAALDRASVEAAEGIAALEAVVRDIDLDPRRLEQVEERLFALRAAARKHNTDVDSLPDLHERMKARLAAIDSGSEGLEALRKAEAEARTAYLAAAERLSAGRRDAAGALDAAVQAELDPLRMGKAVFVTRVERLDEKDWGAEGIDRVAFEVATNPGAPPGPIAKIASGGELSRFTLALKVVLARIGAAGTLIFDEVDAGIGGAVADAVGQRLARLAEDVQVLVVTHSPQVAARGTHHWQVRKIERGGGVATEVAPLSEEARREEIARMLAGARITDEARAAALSLMTGRS